jgi:hypothetical protein
VSFPFFDRDFVSAPNNELLLYRRVFKPGIDNLFFIALSGVPGPPRTQDFPFLELGHT